MSPEDFVKQSHEKGYNCSQTVLLYFANNCGIDESIALKISQGFAKGMYIGSNCGVRSGAYMVLGLKYAHDKKTFKAKLNEFNTRFRELSSYDNCDDILQQNNSISYNDLGGGPMLPVCNELIIGTINILNNILGG